jgi:hypothetical protein
MSNVRRQNSIAMHLLEPQDPFLRVESPREKWFSLVTNAFLAVFSILVVIWALDGDMRQPATWICGYGGLFFGMNTLHSWRSIKHGWNIREENRDFYGPLFSWITSKWLFIALVLGWYATSRSL